MSMAIVRFIVGSSLALAIVFLLPILDILEMFLYLVLLPVVFLASIGLMSEGAYEMIRQAPQALSDLRERMQHHREELAAG